MRAFARDAVFTTHTPVPAGNEQFAADLVRRYLAPQCERARLSLDEVLALGDAQQAGSEGTFNLTALALRLSSFANGVSRLNAEVASQMWKPLLAQSAQAPSDQSPIRPITNGVHPTTWVGEDMMRILTRALGATWSERLLAPEDWARILEVPDDELWQAHLAQAERLGRFLRSRLRDQFARHGHSPEELRQVSTLFRADTLTIGFARRFATYKRASLIFSDLDRLYALLSDPDSPGADPLRRQGASRRPAGPGAHPAHLPALARSPLPRPRLLPRGLRHARGGDAGAGRRRLAQHAAPADGSLGHLRPESGDERRPQRLACSTAGGRRPGTARTAG